MAKVVRGVHQMGHGHLKHLVHLARVGLPSRLPRHQRHHRRYPKTGAREISRQGAQPLGLLRLQPDFFVRLAQRCGHGGCVAGVDLAAGQGHLTAMSSHANRALSKHQHQLFSRHHRHKYRGVSRLGAWLEQGLGAGLGLPLRRTRKMGT